MNEVPWLVHASGLHGQNRCVQVVGADKEHAVANFVKAHPGFTVRHVENYVGKKRD